MLQRQGAKVIARNVKVGGGELDILALVGGERTVIEVRSVREEPDPTGADPVAAFDHAKGRQVRKLAGSIGCSRVDVVAIRFWRRGIDLHWLPYCA